VTSSLIRHTHILSGERPYDCNVYNIGFNYKYNLKAHTCTHSGEHPYTCPKCNVFSRQIGLIMHKRLYSDEIPYGCEVCNKAFKSTEESDNT
jgi:uncharacterized Zn-finger protein